MALIPLSVLLFVLFCFVLLSCCSSLLLFFSLVVLLSCCSSSLLCFFFSLVLLLLSCASSSLLCFSQCGQSVGRRRTSTTSNAGESASASDSIERKRHLGGRLLCLRLDSPIHRRPVHPFERRRRVFRRLFLDEHVDLQIFSQPHHRPSHVG
jgi:hypothetical protein